MHKPTDRIKIIKRKIEMIEEIISKNSNGKITLALKDEKILRPAIFMHIIAIAEQFKKDDLKGINDIRNFVSHDYDGVNLSIIEESIRVGLENLKTQADKILQ